MKNIRSYAFPILLFLIVSGGIYAYQQSLTISPKDLHTFEGIYKKKDLKKDRTYPLKLYFEKDKNVYVLNKNAYKAWEKYRFLRTVKAGEVLQLSIKKENIKQTTNNKANLIKVITLKKKKTTYLSLKNYNSFQKWGLFKFYLLSAFGLAVYFVWMKLQANAIKL